MTETGYSADKQALIARLHRIEGQVRGIERMIEDDRYCIDVLTQISAATTALDTVALKVLDDHVSHCVAGAMASGDPARGGGEDEGAPRGRAAVREHALERLNAGDNPAHFRHRS